MFDFSVRWDDKGIHCEEYTLERFIRGGGLHYKLMIHKGLILQFDIYDNPPSYGGLLWMHDPSQRAPRFLLGMCEGYYLTWDRSERYSDNDIVDFWSVCRSSIEKK